MLSAFAIRKTETYAKWLDGLRDVRARARVLVRVERLAAGNPGDVRPVGEGVPELRIAYGPGYRVYFRKQTRTIVVLLAGGDKVPGATTFGPLWTSHETCRQEQ